MTDEKEMTDEKQFGIIEQYVKDLSVENLLTPKQMVEKSLTPNGEINLGLASEEIGENLYQITMKLTVTAKDKQADEKLYIIEIEYVAIAHIEGFEQETSALVAVEVPRTIFPFIRQIVAHSTAQAGFPTLMLTPIDFVSLFLEQQMQEAEQQGKQ